MSPMSLTLQEKISFWQFDIFFTILCLVGDKLLKVNLKSNLRLLGCRFFIHFHIGLSNMQCLSFTF